MYEYKTKHSLYWMFTLYDPFFRQAEFKVDVRNAISLASWLNNVVEKI